MREKNKKTRHSTSVTVSEALCTVKVLLYIYRLIYIYRPTPLDVDQAFHASLDSIYPFNL